MFSRVLLLFGFGAVSLLASPAAAQQQIGTTHRVTPAAHGSVAGTLAVGSGVHADETIGTDKGGVAGLRFHDQSTLDARMKLERAAQQVHLRLQPQRRKGRLRCRQGFVPVLDRRAGRQSQHSDQDPGWGCSVFAAEVNRLPTLRARDGYHG